MKKNDFIKILINSGIEKTEARAEVELILEYILNKTKEELIFIDDFDEDKILPILNKRIETKLPIQYILGFAPFMGEKFIIDETVLIPRDDTEILVREAIKYSSENSKILDIGSGSGIISCMIGKLTEAKVIGVDISKEALNISEKNAEKLNLKNVKFIQSDLFENINEKFDIIVSNPPYIPKKMKEKIQEEVKYEPDLALYTEDDTGLYFYKKITEKAPLFLNDKGFILFEMMIGQAPFIKDFLLKNNFINIEIIKDVQGQQRVIKAQKSGL